MSDIKSGKPDSRQLSRRRFITDTAQAACAVSLLGLGLSWTAEKSAAHDIQPIATTRQPAGHMIND
ncbi:twin-arginine translocation signal domain-containing protein [Endozoicomonas ascidiicola]|uniref:twin-arginine translocation signal domain-containing protein n=1 Tax=Endozoicomonas ascidiicola TaxID=1698521 RepID=UPI0008298EA3|nr:twin-arginine translocation signal domain-containing protein [Endozoicomonas ascidiicola]